MDVHALADAAALADEEQGLELARVLGPAAVGDGLDADAPEAGHAAVGLEADVALERRAAVYDVVDALAVEVALVAVADADHRAVVPLAGLRCPSSGAVGVEQVAGAVAPQLLVVVELHLVGRARWGVAAWDELRAAEEQAAVVAWRQAEPQVPDGVAEGLVPGEARAALEALDGRLAVFGDDPPVLAAGHPALEVLAVEQRHPALLGGHGGREQSDDDQQRERPLHDTASVSQGTTQATEPLSENGPRASRGRRTPVFYRDAGASAGSVPTLEHRDERGGVGRTRQLSAACGVRGPRGRGRGARGWPARAPARRGRRPRGNASSRRPPRCWGRGTRSGAGSGTGHRCR